MPNEAPDEDIASLSQEATNESTPEKALADKKAARTPKMKSPPKRTPEPKVD